MVVNTINGLMNKLGAPVLAMAALVAAHPANAEEAEHAAISPRQLAVSSDAASPLGESDDQFRQIFNRLEEMNNHSGHDAPPAARVAVPSAMPLRNAALTSGYGLRTHPVLGGRRAHNGIDLAAPTGTPIYATADGTVSRADRFSSYGNYVSIEHGGSIQTRYAHMSQIVARTGDRVRKGDLIGYVGSTGRSTGPHLHYEIRVAGEAVNPAPYMNQEPRGTFALHAGPGGQGGAE